MTDAPTNSADSTGWFEAARVGFSTYPEKGPKEWGAEQLLSVVRTLQPDTLVNDRLGIPGDYVTPEQYQPDRPLERGSERVVWEARLTLNGSWGYDRDNHDYKDPALLVRMLLQSVACGGNLMSVGDRWEGHMESVAVHHVPAGHVEHGAGWTTVTVPGGEWLVMHWDPRVAVASVVRKELDDPQLTRSWGDHLTRLTLTVPAPGAQGSVAVRWLLADMADRHPEEGTQRFAAALLKKRDATPSISNR
ncbi:alpha-L-fucosidase [Streptomyces sp. NPDC051658]|uniref:alpha-L-fucosidase n=1 Tax=Streptomyces sp. NPDC051658 TaxID=3365667 RepID=UPI0037A2F9E1